MLPLPDIAPGTRVVIGISGGIDSAVAARLLKAAGAEVVGVTLRLRTCSETACDRRSCCGPDAAGAAAAVAAQIGIPHYVVDAREAFDRDVLRPCWDAFDAGRTPNPCVLCNARVRFPLLAAWADSLGGGFVTTGHYARTAPCPGGTTRLLRGLDPAKDQSYFLHAVPTALLGRLLFPLGGFHKTEIRADAAAHGLVNADRPESQDVCFAGPDGQFAEFLRQFFNAPARPGRLLHADGRVLGEHPGIHHFTVGQRRGIGAFGPRPHCVTAIRADSGDVTLSDDPDDLLADTCRASAPVWHGDPPASGTPCHAQIRYRQTAVPATLTDRQDDGAFTVRLQTPVRAVTPGQALVLYNGDAVIGGGVIDAAWSHTAGVPTL